MGERGVFLGRVVLMLALVWGVAPPAHAAKIIPLAIDTKAYLYGLEISLAIAPSARQYLWRLEAGGQTNAAFEATFMQGISNPPAVGQFAPLLADTGEVVDQIQRAVNALIIESQTDPTYADDGILNHHPTNPRVVLVAMIETPQSLDDNQPIFGKIASYTLFWLTGASSHELRGYLLPFLPDRTPPTTTATLSPQPNAAGWHRADVRAVLSATASGGRSVKEIVYSATGAHQVPETKVARSTVTLMGTREGTTTLSYYARDTGGNTEAPKSLTVRIDKSAPRLAVPANITRPRDKGLPYATIAVSPPAASDANAGVTVVGLRSDGKGLADPYPLGATTINWAATDVAGNQSYRQQRVTVTPK